MADIILASTSVYRKKLLEDLGLTVTCIAPLADESTISINDFPPKEIAEKRAYLKTSSVFNSLAKNSQIVIGGDQIAVFENEILGKPHTKENAIKQLEKMNGKTHQLITSMVIFYQEQFWTHTDTALITFKQLSLEQIKNYVDTDKPLDCAGSYKIESKGLWLIKSIDCKDFTAIQGLPMIALTNVLHELGVTQTINS